MSKQHDPEWTENATTACGGLAGGFASFTVNSLSLAEFSARSALRTTAGAFAGACGECDALAEAVVEDVVELIATAVAQSAIELEGASSPSVSIQESATSFEESVVSKAAASEFSLLVRAVFLNISYGWQHTDTGCRCASAVGGCVSKARTAVCRASTAQRLCIPQLGKAGHMACPLVQAHTGVCAMYARVAAHHTCTSLSLQYAEAMAF